MIVPAIDPNTETTFRVKVDHRAEGKRFYVVNIVAPAGERHVLPRRTAWFDRANLELVRVQFYEPDGTCTEDVQYSNYQNYQSIHYPSHIELNRPEDDYQVTITLENAKFNVPIPAERFDLKKPEGAELIDLSARKPEEHPNGQ